MGSGGESRLSATLGVFATAFRNRSLLLVELAWLAFNGAEWGVWLVLTVWAYTHGGALAVSLDHPRAARPVRLRRAVSGRHHRQGAGGHGCCSSACWSWAGRWRRVAAAMALDAPASVVFVLAPVMNLALSVPRPAQAALLPGVVRTPLELTAGNVVSSWMENASVLLAPALTGVLLGVGGPALAAGALAGITLAGAFLVVGIPGPRRSPSASEGVSLTAEVRESVTAVWRVPAVRTLVGVVGSQYILVGALDVLYVVLAITTLGHRRVRRRLPELGVRRRRRDRRRGDGHAGGTTPAGAGARRRDRHRRARARRCSASTRPWPARSCCIAVAGVSRSVFDVTGRILLQRAAPPQVLGQVFALLESLMDAGLAIAAVFVPAARRAQRRPRGAHRHRRAPARRSSPWRGGGCAASTTPPTCRRSRSSCCG